MGRFATGVTILTVNGPDARPLGMTASSLASVSLVPPLVSVCVDHEAELHDAILAAPVFVVNILESGQEVLSRRFADRHDDRFDGVGYHRSPEGLVLLDGALAHLECDRFASYPGGRPHPHHRPGDRRSDRRRPAAALLPRRIRLARMSRRTPEDHARSASSCSTTPPPIPKPSCGRCGNVARANRWFGGAAAVRHGLERVLRGVPRGRPLTLLDLGTGAGDLPQRAVRWARRRGYTLRPVGLELNRTAAAMARRAGVPCAVACAGAPPMRREVGGHRAGEPGGPSPHRRLRPCGCSAPATRSRGSAW